jgi:Holliday junction resolvase-like predicted endonuclease
MQHSHLIAERLGFSSVRYEVGSWFNRSNDKQSGQIDLLFIRADRVITLCEVKFRNTKIGREIIEEIERKKQALFNPKRYTIETVLISASKVTEDLKDEKYFNRILSLEDIFEKESAGVTYSIIE